MGPPVTHLRTTDTENLGGKDQQPVFIKLSKSLQQWLEIKSIMQGIYKVKPNTFHSENFL